MKEKLPLIKRILYIVIALVIIAGILVTSYVGFNVSLAYSESKRIEVYIGKDFEMSDIRVIANEVFPKQEIMLQKVEVFEDIASITVKEATDEQINSLNDKINAKYELENKTEDITVVNVPHTRLRDILKVYLMGILISMIFIFSYYTIRFRKMKPIRTSLKAIGKCIVAVGLVFSIIVITRLPFTQFTMPLALAVLAISEFVVLYKDETKLEKQIAEKDANKKEKKKD